MLAGGGRVVDDEIHELVDADVAQAGGEEDGEKFVFANRFVQRRDQMLLGDGAGFEELFHQLVFAFGDQLDQLFVSFFGGGGHIGGNRAFLALAVSAHLVGVGLHADEIDNAAETLLAADGKLQRGDGAAEGAGERFERAVGVGALAIHAVDDDHARQVDFVAVIPDALGHDLDSGDAIHHDQRGVNHGQHHLGLVDEHVEAGSVEQIDLDLRHPACPTRQKRGRWKSTSGGRFLLRRSRSGRSRRRRVRGAARLRRCRAWRTRGWFCRHARVRSGQGCGDWLLRTLSRVVSFRRLTGRVIRPGMRMSTGYRPAQHHLRNFRC